MADYPLKTPAQFHAQNPITPAATDIILAWQGGALGGELRSDFAAYLEAELDVPVSVQAAFDALVDGAPAGLDTFSEVATALNDRYTKVESDGLYLSVDGSSGPIGGLRNALINASFIVNQWESVSTSVVVAANTYWRDRWKSGPGGCTLSISGNVATITAGTLVQVVDGVDVLGGDHVINWTGTATCSVNGTGRAKGESFTLPAGANVTVSFGTGTLSFPQLEQGGVATPFERRPKALELQICQSYYERTPRYLEQGYAQASQLIRHPKQWRVEKRVTPTVTPIFLNSINAAGGGIGSGSVSTLGYRVEVTKDGTAGIYVLEHEYEADAEIY